MMDERRRDPYLQEKRMKKINREIRRRSWMRQTRRKLLLPFIRMKRAKPIVWEAGYGGNYPACPRCGELVYYTDMCCFCGQRLKDGVPVGKVMEQHEC